ncbi:hypothetical protein FF38_05818 [Lucilia cuprina]|uniref:Uncharacterized protein n=1 Tax=Lucilia cuprina TaxID=7375 RepID=A0A0L0CMD2_LUCCU|nr:hypothetical protein FF38_05818 [Lucilia cuprina]
MLISTMKILIALILSLMFTISLVKLVLLFWNEYPSLLLYGFRSDPALPTVDLWLEQNNLTDYIQLFQDKGQTLLKMFTQQQLQGVDINNSINTNSFTSNLSALLLKPHNVTNFKLNFD